MNKIRVRLLGGFEVWSGDQQVGGFESQKVRALLAYLACHRSRTFSRDHLAGLLWPEREPEAARHALRQAVYNLRSKLPDGESLLFTSHSEIRVHPKADFWVDVEAFEESVRRGTEREAIDPQQLSSSAQLYRGELLAGFFVKESPAFDEWLAAERARLRGAAVEALRKLIESYSRRGEHRFGAHYAQRLVSLEPLSEEAHRELIRLWARSGQRSRALVQYEELVNRLREELGVEPRAETRALHESILAEVVEEEAAARSEEPIGPLVPLVGRRAAYEVLREGWHRAQEGKVHSTLVTGEGGIGKTRLIKSFLDVATSKRRALVLKGGCHELSPLMAYQPFLEVLRSALEQASEAPGQVYDAVPGEVRQDLVRLIPEFRELWPETGSPESLPPGPEGRRRLFGSVVRFLELLCEDGDPLILFLDDLHLADWDALDLLGFLMTKLEGTVWIVAACRPEGLDRDHPLNRIFRRAEKEGMATQLEVERLEPEALEEVAESLVEEDQAPELARFLEERSGGLPLGVSEVINYLWDEGILASRKTGGWALTGSLADLDLPSDLDELIRLRIRRLPNSTRRLATLAAMIGQSFDVHVLQEAADEHVTVVEVGLEIMLKRWLIRQFAYGWTSTRRERDIVLWARGARRGSLEFAHKRIRSAVHGELNPLRRQAMHGQLAQALERLRGGRDGEALAYHFAVAGQWEKALPYLERAARRAASVQAADTARRYCDQAIEGLSRLAAAARSEVQAERWRGERERMQRVRERLAAE